MTKDTKPLFLMTAIVLLLLDPCFPSPISSVTRHVQHPDLPLPTSSHKEGLPVGSAGQMYNRSGGHEVAPYWKQDGSDFPNPFDDPEICNTGLKKHGAEYAFACDADYNLKEKDVKKLSSMIDNIISYTKCQCEFKGCNRKHPMGRFSIGIAVTSNITGSLDRVKTFSDSLRSTYWRNMQRCDDFLVIALEVNSQTIHMSSDTKVRAKMPDTCARVIIDKTKAYFAAKDYYTGFSEILRYVKMALKGGECGQEPTPLSTGQIIGIVIGAVIGGALIIFIAVACVGQWKEWEWVVETPIGKMVECLQIILLTPFLILAAFLGK